MNILSKLPLAAKLRERFKKPRKAPEQTEQYYLASQWTLMRRKFRRHKLAIVGAVVLAVLYVLGIFADFFSPYDIYRRYDDYLYAPPVRVRLFDKEGLHAPFVYKLILEEDPVTWRTTYHEDRSQRYPLRFFVRGEEYKLLGLFRTDIHLVGVDEPARLFLFGTDKLGRDLFSRTLHAARISLTIGLLGVIISFFLGCIIGGISGFYGGAVDTVIQRIIEFLISLPTIPVWMALSAALPVQWTGLQVYFGITIILSMIGWTHLARVVRGKILELRESDFVVAAKLSGMRDFQILTRHLLPSFISYLIVNLTLAVPGMIIGETSLSFLGLGLRAPTVSWGVLLQDAQNVRAIAMNAWLLIPGLFVIVTVIAFNALGDGLRDAADPYKE